MNGMISLRSQAWLPRVITSAPAANSAAAMSGATEPVRGVLGVHHRQVDARTPRNRGSAAATASRPERPTTSPMNRMRIQGSLAGDHAVIRRHRVQRHIRRPGRHLRHLLPRIGDAERISPRQRGQRAVVEAGAVAQPVAAPVERQQRHQQEIRHCRLTHRAKGAEHAPVAARRRGASGGSSADCRASA